MGVLNGQLANQDTFNEAFLDKNADTETSNKITLSDPDEGSTVDSVQGSINEIFDTQGTSEGDANAKVYANTNYIADGDSQKTAIEKLDAQAGTSNTSLTTHVADLTAHRNFDTLANLTTWAATADNGWFAFATDAKQSFQVIDGALEPIGGGGGFDYLGTWNASTNTPTLPVGDEENGDFYIVSVAGTQDIGNGSVDWAVGDWAIYNDLTGFLKIDNSELVSNVNGQTGAVVLDADDIAETATRYWDVKNNRTATTNPTVTNDDSENYSQGSTWLNTSTGTMYVCTDASTGAAVWKIQSGSDSKNTRWGNINRNTVSSSDWVVTGDAAVTDTSTDGSIQDSFQVNTGTAGNTAEIEHIIPPAAIDVRYNQAVIEYQLFDITDPVVCTVLDWNDNTIGQVELPQTGSGAATADNLRFAHATVDFSFPFAHGSTFRSVKFQFECASNITAGQFLVNFIQSDSNARDIGQYVESESSSKLGVVGVGSTDTHISNWGINEENALYKIESDSTNGTRITIKRNCEASFGMSVFPNAASATYYGFTKNSTFLTTSIRNASNSPFIISIDSGYGSTVASVWHSSEFEEYRAGDVIRPHHSDAGTTFSSTDSLYSRLVVSARVNRRSIMSEGDIINADETWFSIKSDATLDGARFGQSDTTTTNDGINLVGWTTGIATSSNGWELDVSSLGLTVRPNITVTHNGDTSTNQGRDVVTYCPSPFDTIYISLGDGTVYRQDGIDVKIGKNFPDARNNEIKSIPVDEIIADGNEYPVFGKRINVGGVWYQVFRRAYEGADNSTLDTIPTGLKILDTGGIFATNNWFISRVTGSGSGTDDAYFYYNDSTGAVATSNSSYSFVGAILSFDYYDPARPLYS